jgi:hypothetical protein
VRATDGAKNVTGVRARPADTFRTMANPIGAATQVVAVPVAAIKANPIVWLVFFAIVAAVILRYRATISAWLGGAPLIGERTTAFIR